MIIAHMETDYKYYVMHIVTDLLGDTVLVCRYGSKHNRYSNQQNMWLSLGVKELTLHSKKLKYVIVIAIKPYCLYQS